LDRFHVSRVVARDFLSVNHLDNPILVMVSVELLPQFKFSGTVQTSKDAPALFGSRIWPKTRLDFSSYVSLSFHRHFLSVPTSSFSVRRLRRRH
jgi:hypothetical protein